MVCQGLNLGILRKTCYLILKNMGAFLSIGLVNEVSVGGDTMATEEVKVPLAEHGIHLNIYEGKIKESSWEGKLRPDILEKELLPFLRALYDSMGTFTKFGDAEDILALLEKTPAKERYERLLAANFSSFSNIGLSQIIRLPIHQRHVGVRYYSIRLHSAGKILMEEDGGMFDIFSIALQQQFKEFELSKAIMVDIF